MGSAWASSARRIHAVSLPGRAGRVDPAVPNGSSMTNCKNSRDVCHGRPVKSASSLGMRSLRSCDPGLPHWLQLPGRRAAPSSGRAGREAGQGCPASSVQEGWGSRVKTRGCGSLTPRSVNLVLAHVVGRGSKRPWPFIHRLRAAGAVKPLFG